MFQIPLVIAPFGCHSVRMNASTFEGMAAAIVQQIKAERAAADLTVQQLAEVSGVPYPTLRRYLADERSMSLDAFVAVAGGLGIEPDELVKRAMQRLPQKL